MSEEIISIKNVSIENFQSHLKTSLDFSKGLNVIVGPSDQGKSSIIRAIKWVLYNEPRGMEFIRQGAAAARVSLTLSNGYTIIRERSKSKNRYTVIDPEGKGLDLEGFGNEVPEEVIKAHGIPKVVLDTDMSSALNISDQLEGPFLLSENGAVRAKAIGRLTGIHVIDTAIRDCLTDIKRENQTADRTRKELGSVEEGLKRYDGLERMEENLRNSENILAGLEELLKRKTALEAIRDRLSALEKERAEAESMLGKTGQVKDCQLYIGECEARLLKIKAMVRLNSSRREVGAGLEQAEAILQKTALSGELELAIKGLTEKTGMQAALKRSLDKMTLWTGEKEKVEALAAKLQNTAEGEKLLHGIAERESRLQKITALKEKYHHIAAQVKEGNHYMENNAMEIKKLKNEYAVALKTLGRCPFCSSRIDDEKLSDILRHYEEVHP